MRLRRGGLRPRRLAGGGRDLRLFGSQGEQRAAVLALLLAEQAVAAEVTGDVGTLLLDDVMSELDDARRRLLVGMLTAGGQAIITTTNRHYFTDDELARARVLDIGAGRRGAPAAESTSGATGVRTTAAPARRGAAMADVLAPRRHPERRARPGRRQRRGPRLPWRGRGPPAPMSSRSRRPRRLSRGVLTVECESSTWANELTYLDAGHPRRRLRADDPATPVTSLRFVVGRPHRAADEDDE